MKACLPELSCSSVKVDVAMTYYGEDIVQIRAGWCLGACLYHHVHFKGGRTPEVVTPPLTPTLN